MRDPYAIYARAHPAACSRSIRLDAEPDAADCGTFVHAALGAFVAAEPGGAPADDARPAARATAARRSGELLERPGVRAFWWPRFERIAALVRRDRAGARGARPRRARRPRSAASMAIATPAGPFALTGEGRSHRPARRRRRSPSSTTRPARMPSTTEVQTGLAPQLPLEAAIAAAGGFAGIPAGAPVASSGVLAADRRRRRRSCQQRVEGDRTALARPRRSPALRELIATFDDPATPYLSRPRAAPGAALQRLRASGAGQGMVGRRRRRGVMDASGRRRSTIRAKRSAAPPIPAPRSGSPPRPAPARPRC